MGCHAEIAVTEERVQPLKPLAELHKLTLSKFPAPMTSAPVPGSWSRRKASSMPPRGDRCRLAGASLTVD